MEIDIIEDKKNPLLSRRDIVCMVTKAGTTPSKNDIRSFLTKELKLKSECVFVDRVEQKFGRPMTEVYAKVYDKPEMVPGYVKTAEEEKPTKVAEPVAEEAKSESEPAAEVKETPTEKEEEPKA